MQHKQQGFTLIELMIVVAIIGILAAVAIPAYSDYQSKSKVTAGIAEISAGKSAFEGIVNSGESVTAPVDVGLAATTSNCKISTTPTTIVCELANAPSKVNGKKITLERDTNGVWSCDTDIDAADEKKYTPQSCRG